MASPARRSIRLSSCPEAAAALSAGTAAAAPDALEEAAFCEAVGPPVLVARTPGAFSSRFLPGTAAAAAPLAAALLLHTEPLWHVSIPMFSLSLLPTPVTLQWQWAVPVNLQIRCQQRFTPTEMPTSLS